MIFLFGRKPLVSRRSTRRSSLRTPAALLGTGVLLALAGCGGGGSNNNSNPNSANASLTSANLVALTDSNKLLSFNSQTPGTSTTSTVTGMTSGDALRAIDFRFRFGVAGNGQTGLYGIGQFGNTGQLYLLSIAGTTATARPVGTRFNLTLNDPTTAFGFDFNPTVDRIRLVESTANLNLRLNPNAGGSPVVDGDPTTAGVQGDGPIAYAAGDVNFGNNPDAVGAAYTNNDADAATSTTLYVLDAALNTLTTQGRVADNTGAAVSPNTGQLFTVAKLNIVLGRDVGFDIATGANAGFLSSGNRIYGIVVEGAGLGTLSGGARLTAPTNSKIIGLAVTE